MSDAVTREETLLNAIATGETVDIVPVTRKEKYLRYLAGIGEKPSKPITREEMFLDKIQAGGSGGGGGDEASVLDSLIDGSITEITSNATSVVSYMFYYNSNIVSVKLPLATNIASYSFNNSRNLKSIECPLVTNVASYSFQDSGKLENIHFPSLEIVNSGAFKSCSSLKVVTLPKARSISASVFDNCSALTTVDLPVVRKIESYLFSKCKSIITIILRSENMCSLESVSAFNNCYHFHGTVDATYNPDGLKDGYIYVPKALIEDYKVATNWSEFATQFRALEDYTVDGTITGELDESKI